MTSRIGVYAGTFDPVHTGHITFALQAIEQANLDQVYFLPERRPRHKNGVEHFGHRVAMIKKAAKPHPKFSVIELDEVSFTVKRTIPILQKRFPDSELVFLFGSDTVQHLPEWAHSDKLLQNELVIGVRATEDAQVVQDAINAWSIRPSAITLFESSAPEVSSSKIREALRSQQEVSGALTSVRRYSDQNWLYVSLQ